MNIYAHFPFCRAKCTYCALLSRAGTSAGARADHVARLVREAAERGLSPAERGLSPVETLYFGGGSPALCDLTPLAALAEGLSPQGEFTVELHPCDVTDAKLAELVRLGVNRISLGVQSFDDAALAAMNRGHTAAAAVEAFRRVKGTVPNAGLDLIAGWPGTSDASWRATLDQALALDPVHVSCYTLIREPRTRLDLLVRQGRLALPDDDAALLQADRAREAFAAAGLVRYEVSNYARPGFACRHNCAVWRGEDYVGLGEGAHGREGVRRTVGTATGYTVTTVDPTADALERALLGLRTAAGVDLGAIARRWPGLADRLPAWRETLAALVAPGILDQPRPGVFTPTPRGFEVCDAVMAELL